MTVAEMIDPSSKWWEDQEMEGAYCKSKNPVCDKTGLEGIFSIFYFLLLFPYKHFWVWEL